MALNIPSAPYDPTPILTAMGKQNALTSSQLDNQIKRAQAKYAEQNAYADALSKTAYAQTAPANALAQFMSGPAAANLTRDQSIALANQFQNYIKGYNLGNIPNPAAPNSFNNMGGGLLTTLLGQLFNKGQNTAPQANANPIAQAPAAAQVPSGNAVSNIPQGQNAPTNAIVPGAPSTPFNAQAAGLAIPGAQGGLTPSAGAKAQENALNTGAVAEAGNIAAQWNKEFEKSTKEAEGARNNLNILDKMTTARNELNRYEKGPVGGKVPAYTTAAQDFDKAQSALADSVARAQQQGHITATDRDTYNSMKPTRDMTDAAYARQKNFIKGMSERVLEKPAFDYATSQMRLTPQQKEIIWQYYIKSRPFYDAKTHKELKDNIGTWEDFLTPQKMKEAFSPRAQMAANPKKTFKMPEFPKDEKEGRIAFQKWYLQQSPEIQKQVQEELEE